MRELGPVIVVWLISLGIIVAQHDLGTGVLIFGMFIVMLYVATGKTSWVLIGLVMVAAGVRSPRSSSRTCRADSTPG